MDNKSRAVTGGKPLNAHITTSLTVQKPRDKVYELLRKFDNMPKYVNSLTHVRVLDAKVSEWDVQTAKNNYKATVMIIEEKPGQLIKLQAYLGSDFKGECTLTFTDVDGDSTKINADVHYHNPLGGVANLFGPLVESKLKEPKRKFVAAIEADM
ncbi:MAG: SRPBCC family protein [Sphingobacteriales bacterium JAD_PAG50586_3]|nr:MAG: SRPBCC family protein [Sphingobacteriales bacterium JAD_PAG50586_3]